MVSPEMIQQEHRCAFTPSRDGTPLACQYPGTALSRTLGSTHRVRILVFALGATEAAVRYVLHVLDAPMNPGLAPGRIGVQRRRHLFPDRYVLFALTEYPEKLADGRLFNVEGEMAKVFHANDGMRGEGARLGSLWLPQPC